MNQNAKIAVLGLGAMDSRMALKWLNAGYEVIVWNRTPHKTERLKAENAQVVATTRDAAHRADVVVAMVRDNVRIAQSPDSKKALKEAQSTFETLLTSLRLNSP